MDRAWPCARPAAMELSSLVRDVPDFPRPGIMFKDITPLLADPSALAQAIATLAGAWGGRGISKVLGVEARGFILAPAVALELGAGFVPARKPGKLPWQAMREAYSLEYGSDCLEIHVDSFTAADRVLVVDDVLATGGTAAAAVRLARRQGASVVGCAFLVELTFLGGRKRLDVAISSVLGY